MVLQDELMEKVVLPQLSHLDTDSDLEVSKRAIQLLIDMATACHSPWCLDLLDILRKVSVVLLIHVHDRACSLKKICFTCSELTNDVRVLHLC